ncbi:TonB-dependent receptor domain-containing protein [Thalassotalea aquiviva]|uniref:TonB-dependent receptor n=1 Tax=Thalassotalea aquiviva TaxID=3242415 RepID=UPI003529E5CA
MYKNSEGFTTTFKRSAAAAAVALSLGASMPAVANNTTGYITGSSITQEGEVLSAVSIKVKNVETGLERTVVSSGSGAFRFPLLPPGKYDIIAEKAGFQASEFKSVVVGLAGKVNLNIAMVADNVERIEVRGSAISMVDITSSSTGIVVDSLTLDKVPVSRDFTGVALLAPGTAKGDTAFGNNPTIGGASVAENAYYINGLNITNFRTGVGSSRPPFEMYDTFEVKTGGYSAEFGRVTGGVINAKTKSGTNEFKAGVNVYWEPDALRANKPSVKREDGTYYVDNTADTNDFQEVNVWASGALIKDTLFFYGLYSPRSDEFDYNGGESTLGDGSIFQREYTQEMDDDFWAAKIDWYINENNIIELTGFSDKRTVTTTTFDAYDGVREGEGRVGFDKLGGDNYIVKYTSVLTDDFSVSAQYGINKYDRTSVSALDSNPAVYSYYSSTGSWVPGGDWANFSFGQGDDKREAYRIDADWYLGDHEIRFGVDFEQLTASDITLNSGGAYYLYVYEEDNETVRYVRHRTYQAGGEFDSENFAFYVQDQWQVTDNLVLNLGLRNDSFENFNGAGESFVKLENQWAPRLGMVWDVNGDGESKVWASYGRYFLPVAANTNVRLAGAETYIQEYYNYNGMSSDGLMIPNLDGGVYPGRPTDVYSDGDVPETDAIVDSSIDPMYSDEFILGYQFQLNDSWSMAVQSTYRELSTTIEDVAIDYGFNEYLEDEFGASCTECSGFHYYVLTNPNTDLTVTTDPDGDGPLAKQAYTIPADYLGYPDAVRKYASVDFTFNRAWDQQWMMSASYTWSHSWGNNEGYVRSDNGQDDAGLTTNFDQPGLLDGGYGNLPNDRRHAVKVFGAYQINDDFNVGLNFRWQSGKPRSAFGIHPTDAFAALYDAESFYKGGELAPRGSEGVTPSNWNVDLTASYDLAISDYTVQLRADVFNVFNNDTATEFNEIYDDENLSNASEGVFVKSPTYGNAQNWQTPRYVRFSASVRF